MKQTKVGLIGCGEWGKYILRDLKLLGCHVTVVSISKKSRAFALENNADSIVDCVTQLKDIDGVIIATPVTTHFSVINQISCLSVPIFVEKPMTANLAEAEQLASELSDRLFVMHKWRYHSGIRALAEIAATKELGKVLGLRTNRMNWGNHHDDIDMIWTCLPHDLSITIEILGSIPKPRSAVALEWNNEAIELLCVLGESPWNVIEISSARTEVNREIRLECEEGIAVLKDGYAEQIEIYHKQYWGLDPQKHTEQRSFVLEMPLMSELRDFISYLHGGPRPKCDAQEGLAVVRAITELRNLAAIKHSGILLNKHLALSQGA